MVEPSHELLIHVVEAERVARAALPAGLEVDGVLDVPVLFRVVFGDPIPAVVVRGTSARVVVFFSVFSRLFSGRVKALLVILKGDQKSHAKSTSQPRPQTTHDVVRSPRDAKQRASKIIPDDKTSPEVGPSELVGDPDSE